MKERCLDCGHDTDCKQVTKYHKGKWVFPCYICKNGCFKGCYCCEEDN